MDRKNSYKNRKFAYTARNFIIPGLFFSKRKKAEMAKEIKVTFKKEEEYLYNYVMEQGKGKFLKEIIKSLLENKDISIPSNNNLTSDKNDLMDKLEKMQLDILEIKNMLSSPSNQTDKKDLDISNNNKVGISKDFNIDDLG